MIPALQRQREDCRKIKVWRSKFQAKWLQRNSVLQKQEMGEERREGEERAEARGSLRVQGWPESKHQGSIMRPCLKNKNSGKKRRTWPCPAGSEATARRKVLP